MKPEAAVVYPQMAQITQMGRPSEGRLPSGGGEESPAEGSGPTIVTTSSKGIRDDPLAGNGFVICVICAICG